MQILFIRIFTFINFIGRCILTLNVQTNNKSILIYNSNTLSHIKILSYILVKILEQCDDNIYQIYRQFYAYTLVKTKGCDRIVYTTKLFISLYTQQQNFQFRQSSIVRNILYFSFGLTNKRLRYLSLTLLKIKPKLPTQFCSQNNTDEKTHEYQRHSKVASV